MEARAEQFQRNVGAVVSPQHRFQRRTEHALPVRPLALKKEELLLRSVRSRTVPEPLLRERNPLGVVLQVAFEERSPAWTVGPGNKRIRQACRREPTGSMRQEDVGPAVEKGVQVEQSVTQGNQVP